LTTISADIDHKRAIDSSEDLASGHNVAQAFIRLLTVNRKQSAAAKALTDVDKGAVYECIHQASVRGHCGL
jgi:hypothetical protein